MSTNDRPEPISLTERARIDWHGLEAPLAELRSAVEQAARLITRSEVGIVAVARHQFPGLSDEDSVKELARGISRTFSAIASAQDESRRIQKREEAELKSTNLFSIQRARALDSEIERRRGEMQRGDQAVAKQRETLRQAGYRGDELTVLIPDFDRDADEARISELTAERDAITKFLSSHDVSDLPPTVPVLSAAAA